MLKNSVVTLIFLIILATSSSLFSQINSSYIEMDQYPGQKVPKSLLTKISINLNQVSFEKALETISEKGNFKLNYNRNRIPVEKTVSVNMENVYAMEALLHILKKTGTQLNITKEGNLAIVPLKNDKITKGIIKGRVIDSENEISLIGTNIMLVGTYIGGTSDKNGNFIIENIPAGTYTVRFSYIGYDQKKIENVEIIDNNEIELSVELKPHAILLKEITVTPSQFSIMGDVPTVKQSMTHEDLQTVTFGEDLYRAVTRLPGISASDFSAKFTVRGGENDEILVLMDGMEIYEPFHLKDIDGGALSIIDVAAIESIDLLTGGFPAEYGNRMTGVFNIKSTQMSAGKKRTSLGLSLMNTRFMSEGSFKQNRGSWLFSARRGYLDVVLDLMGEEAPPKPTYYDILGNIHFKLTDKHTISANILHARDNLNFIEDDEDIDKTSYGNSYAWVTLKSVPNSKIYIQSIASYGNIKHDRFGINYTNDLSSIYFNVDDKKNVDLFGFKQDWNFDFSDKVYLKWGFDLKGLKSSYDYFSQKQNYIYRPEDEDLVWMSTNQANFHPSGSKFSAYISNRFRIFTPLTTELGLRYDHISYSDDKLISPRINFAYTLGKQTFLRGGWGYFYQSEGIHEIRVPDKETSFFPAELAKHWVAGLEHTFGNGLNIRFEGYHKNLSNIRPTYRNWSNDIEIFPELQNDRFKLNFNGGVSKGLEFYAKYDRGGKITWWSSYGISDFKDDIRSLIYEGITYSDKNGIYPGRYNQKHTIYFDLNYRPNRKWHFNLS